MNQSERLLFLIKYLMAEISGVYDGKIPENEDEQFDLYRSLVNVRNPKPISDEYLKIEDEFLKAEIEKKGIIKLEDLKPVWGDFYIWQGDITLLKVDAIVNAANSALLGCFAPCHLCIDNCIHTFAGVRLRLKCNEIMENQGTPEPTGKAKITPAYNLPCKYVIHTVDPIIYDKLTEKDENLLTSCYSECLKLADENNLESIAFCCVSTGVFRFPNDRAAEIALKTVEEYKEKTGSKIKVIFNVFKDSDREIYEKLFRTN